jgi:hypothetical protein
MSRFLDDLLVGARQDLVEREDYITLTLANRKYINIVDEIPEGVPTWEFSQYTRLGQAAVILNSATFVPVTNRTTSKRSVNVFPIRVGFEVTSGDIKTARALNGTNLISENLADNFEAANQKLDIIAYSGEVGTTLQGLANIPNVTTVNFPTDGTGSSAAWSTKSPSQILRDLNLIASKVPEQTALTKFTNRLLMPASKLMTLQNTPYTTTNGESILTVFLRNQAALGNGMGIREVIGHPVLETLGAGGVGLMLAYNMDSRNNRLHIPVGGDFIDLEYSLTGTTYTVPCEMYTAGIEVKKTLELAYANVS